jgi:hypothetical protein
MTTPTTNLLEWIDERIAFHSKEYPKNKPLTILNRLIELDIFRARILQEVENEKAVIEDAVDSVQLVNRRYYKGIASDDIIGKEISSPDPLNDGRDYFGLSHTGIQYYQTTFNPNNDERK